METWRRVNRFYAPFVRGGGDPSESRAGAIGYGDIQIRPTYSIKDILDESALSQEIQDLASATKEARSPLESLRITIGSKRDVDSWVGSQAKFWEIVRHLATLSKMLASKEETGESVSLREFYLIQVQA